MAGRLLAVSVRSLRARPVAFGTCGAHSNAQDEIRAVIGNREIVGFGYNGQPAYADRAEFPMPAIRWQEPNATINALREKEKGDWHKLSIEEKKALYRASFRQTFAEFKAPTGEWKSILGYGLFFATFGLWAYILMKLFVYNPLPASFEKERQEAQLKRILDLKMNPITGISSEWDYENKKWK